MSEQLASRWKRNRLERQSQELLDVADQIRSGNVTIRGVSERTVIRRLERKAELVRSGKGPIRRSIPSRADELNPESVDLDLGPL